MTAPTTARALALHLAASARGVSLPRFRAEAERRGIACTNVEHNFYSYLWLARRDTGADIRWTGHRTASGHKVYALATSEVAS